MTVGMAVLPLFVRAHQAVGKKGGKNENYVHTQPQRKTDPEMNDNKRYSHAPAPHATPPHPSRRFAPLAETDDTWGGSQPTPLHVERHGGAHNQPRRAKKRFSDVCVMMLFQILSTFCIQYPPLYFLFSHFHPPLRETSILWRLLR